MTGTYRLKILQRRMKVKQLVSTALHILVDHPNIIGRQLVLNYMWTPQPLII